MKKRYYFCLITCMIGIFSTSSAFGCTGFVAGKDATADGFPIIARTEDLSGAHNKTFKVYPRTKNKAPVQFRDSIGFEIELPKVSFKYTAVCDAEQSEGIYDEVGFNEHGVAMSATVSASPGKYAQEYDPLVENGLSEASITTVVLPYITTAREGIERIAGIIDKHGSAEGNILFIADNTEVWYMEIFSGHQYAAVKVPHDSYAVIPNHFLLGDIDVMSPEVIASKDLIALPKAKGFYQEINGKFHAAKTYSDDMEDYDRVRIWGGQNKLSPLQSVEYDTPLFSIWRKADKKITLDDVMELQRYRYEDTEKNANLPENNTVRAIGTCTSMECHIIQMKDTLPKSVGGVLWLSMASAEHSVYLPFYGNITDTIPPYKVSDTSYSEDSFYWVMRGINVLSALDRKLYGKNIRSYWKEYEQKLIKEQGNKDAELNALYLRKGEKAAAKYATRQGIEQAASAFEKAREINKELMTFAAQHEGRTPKKPFEVSDNR
ncbi:MAG: C69 family dipeptidase [Treponema sp.]